MLWFPRNSINQCSDLQQTKGCFVLVKGFGCVSIHVLASFDSILISGVNGHQDNRLSIFMDE